MERNPIKKEYILFTSNNFPTGGPGATYVNLFCKGVKENGGQISVYLFKGHTYKGYKNDNGRKNRTEYGVNYTYLGFANRPNQKVLKVLEDILSILRTTCLMLILIPKIKKTTILVYSDEFLLNIPVYLFSKLFGIQLVSFISESYNNEEAKRMGIVKSIKLNLFYLNHYFLNRLPDKLIVFSAFLKDFYTKKGYNKDNIILHPNLTDLKEWYIPNQEIQYTIGYAGTPSKKDGIIDLLYAIKLLKEKKIFIKVLIVGDSTNNESLIPNFQMKCTELNIQGQVFFAGLVPQYQVKEYLNKCLILSVTRPTTTQTKAGFPTKLGEYMACKKVVLATRFGDVEEYFTDKTNIVLAEPDNPVSIAANIEWILNNSEKSRTIAEMGFEKARELLDYRKGAIKIMNFLN
ncbi:MAG TPA: glycosyltransferase [Bacteroidia bacterium]|nr:glycosyltransferase [Bacteroidia bacterium]